MYNNLAGLMCLIIADCMTQGFPRCMLSCKEHTVIINSVILGNEIWMTSLSSSTARSISSTQTAAASCRGHGRILKPSTHLHTGLFWKQTVFTVDVLYITYSFMQHLCNPLWKVACLHNCHYSNCIIQQDSGHKIYLIWTRIALDSEQITQVLNALPNSNPREKHSLLFLRQCLFSRRPSGFPL